jgi:hypothetical protein
VGHAGLETAVDSEMPLLACFNCKTEVSAQAISCPTCMLPRPTEYDRQKKARDAAEIRLKELAHPSFQEPNLRCPECHRSARLHDQGGGQHRYRFEAACESCGHPLRFRCDWAGGRCADSAEEFVRTAFRWRLLCNSHLIAGECRECGITVTAAHSGSSAAGGREFATAPDEGWHDNKSIVESATSGFHHNDPVICWWLAAPLRAKRVKEEDERARSKRERARIEGWVRAQAERSSLDSQIQSARKGRERRIRLICIGGGVALALVMCRIGGLDWAFAAAGAVVGAVGGGAIARAWIRQTTLTEGTEP